MHFKWKLSHEALFALTARYDLPYYLASLIILEFRGENSLIVLERSNILYQIHVLKTSPDLLRGYIHMAKAPNLALEIM